MGRFIQNFVDMVPTCIVTQINCHVIKCPKTTLYSMADQQELLGISQFGVEAIQNALLDQLVREIRLASPIVNPHLHLRTNLHYSAQTFFT